MTLAETSAMVGSGKRRRHYHYHMKQMSGNATAKDESLQYKP